MATAVADNRTTGDRILTAALDAFATRGVEATSLDSLAVELGIRKQTILYWFPSKELLLLGVVDHAVDELGRRLSEAAHRARPGRTGATGATGGTGGGARRGADGRDPGRSGAAGAGDLPIPAAGGSIPHVDAPTLDDRLAAVVDAVFRLGATHPQLLAMVREIARVGPPASTHLATAVEPLVATAADALGALGAPADPDRVRAVLLAAGARVVGIVTEAEVRTDLGLAPDLAWLRARRRALLASLRSTLLPPH